MTEWSRETLWRQGSLLQADAIDALKLKHPEAPNDTVIIVATHDCDLAQDPDVEPGIEVVVGRILPEKGNGNCTHAKNTRKLHLAFAGDAPVWVELEASSKTTIDKNDLAPFSPREDVVLTPESHAIFQIWLASRYRRAAFPDEFNRRIKDVSKLAEKITKEVKKHGDLIAGVFFDVDGGEDIARNGPDDTYTLDIIILHAAEPDPIAAEDAATGAAAVIEKAFKNKLFTAGTGWQHIELRSCDAVSEEVLSYREFKLLKRWQLEYVSLAADPQQPVLAE